MKLVNRKNAKAIKEIVNSYNMGFYPRKSAIIDILILKLKSIFQK